MPWPTDPASEFFGRGGWGWDGTAWRKGALLWGYTDSLIAQESEVSDVAASFVITGDAVPAGEVWIVNELSWYRSVNAGNIVRVALYDGAAWYNVSDYPVVANNVFYKDSLNVVLKATQKMKFTFAAATVGETCIVTYWGSKMAVS